MKTAVIYARYSSDNQREESIEAQVRAVRAYAEKENIFIAKIYKDEATTGRTSDRKEFMQMINDSKYGNFDIVFVHKFVRFARNRYDSAFYKRQLKLNGVKLISILEPLDDSPESIILESVLEGMAEYYSANLSREVMKGMVETALQCKHNGGVPPLGYDVDKDGYLTINNSEADVVRLIFQMYSVGCGYNEIIDSLNKHGYKTKRNRPFGKNSINNILTQEKYIGNYVFNKTNRQKFGTNVKKYKDDDEIVRIEGGVPQIITIDTWEKVRSTMIKNRKNSASNKAKEIYLLSGLIFCGKCEGAMVGNRKIAGRNKLIYKTYECNTRKRTKKCDAKSINKEFIEEIVIEELINSMLSPEAVKSVSRKIHEYTASQHNEIEKDISNYEGELKQTQKEIDNIVNAIAAGMFHPSMKDKMDELENKKSELIITISEAKRQSMLNSPDQDMIAKYIGKDSDIKNKSLQEQRLIIQNYVHKVTVYETYVDIEFIVDLIDGGGGSRTHVRKYFHKTFSECRTHFLFRLDLRLCPGLSLSYLRLYNLRSKSPLSRSLL